MKKTLLMAFYEKSPSQVLARDLEFYDIEVTLVHTLQELLVLYQNFDALLIDIDFPYTGHEDFYQGDVKKQSIGSFLDAPYPVFLALKQIEHPNILIFTLFRKGLIEKKLVEIDVNATVLYVPQTCELKELI